MSSLVFQFVPAASGLPYRVTDRSGVQVADGTLDTSDDVVTLTLDLPWGVYEAKAGNAGSTYASSPAYFAEGVVVNEGPGASETAYLIATGPADVSDGGGAAGTLVFEADTREGELPTWCTIVDGDIHLSAEAGTCGFSFNGVYDFDFTATTPQEASGDLSTGFTLKVDGVQKFLDNAATAGDGTDEQSTDQYLNGGLLGGSVVTCEAYPNAADVLDGVATPDVGFTITRLTPLAQRPSQ